MSGQASTPWGLACLLVLTLVACTKAAPPDTGPPRVAWTAPSSAPRPKNLLPAGQRGRLFVLGDGYGWDYYDVSEPDSIAEDLQQQGFQGGGPSWAGIVHGLLSLKAPGVLKLVALDPEGEGLRVTAKERGPLEQIAALVTQAHADPALRAQAIARAKQDGQME